MVPSTLVAGLLGTQAQDIVHGIGLALEKGQDLEGACACAQADIKAFYGMFPMLAWSAGSNHQVERGGH